MKSSTGVPPMKSSTGVPPMKSSTGVPPMKSSMGVPPMESSMGIPPMKSSMGETPMKSSMGVPPVSWARRPCYILVPTLHHVGIRNPITIYNSTNNSLNCAIFINSEIDDLAFRPAVIMPIRGGYDFHYGMLIVILMLF